MVIFVDASLEAVCVNVFEEECESMEAGTTLETTLETMERSTIAFYEYRFYVFEQK